MYSCVYCVYVYIMYLPNKQIAVYARSDSTIKSEYPPLPTLQQSCVTVHALFQIRDIFTILEHLKLKVSISIH